MGWRGDNTMKITIPSVIDIEDIPFYESIITLVQNVILTSKKYNEDSKKALAERKKTTKPRVVKNYTEDNKAE